MTHGDSESDRDDAPPAPEPTPAAGPVQITAPDHWEPASTGVPLRRAAADEDGGGTPPPPQPTARRKPPLLRRLVVRLIQCLLALFLLSLLWVGAYRFVPPPITITMIGDMVAGHGAKRRWMPLERIDRDMARAVIAGEDSGFCTHSGFDFDAIEAAWRANQRGGRVRGGSTISQQTAKNVFLWQGGGFFRKGLEAYFTVLIEALWGKRRIMEVYLNVAETGIGTYGVDAGARRYFKHDATRLTTREAAQIAAVLPLPKKRAGVNPGGFTRRQGNRIAAGIGTVREQRLDACLD